MGRRLFSAHEGMGGRGDQLPLASVGDIEGNAEASLGCLERKNYLKERNMGRSMPIDLILYSYRTTVDIGLEKKLFKTTVSLIQICE